MARKTRSDATVGSIEKKLGVAPGTIRNPDGTDARSDKKLGTLRKEAAAATGKKKPLKKVTAKKPTAKKSIKVKITSASTPDQKSASRRKVKSSAKTSAALVKKVAAAINKTKAK